MRGARMKGEESEMDAAMEQLLPEDEDLEVFGRIIEPLGKRWFKVEATDGVIKTARVRGKLRRRRHWMRRGDIVLLSLWPFKRDRADISVRYRYHQVAWLVRKGYIDRKWAAGEEMPT